MVITALRTEGYGPLAYVYGKAPWVGARPPDAVTPTGVRLLIVWRKEADGVWGVGHDSLHADEPEF